MTKPARIFIVDDDRDLAESLAELLEARGYEVELAHSGEAGVARCRESDFDLVFMDVKLPGMNGVESFLAIRALKPDAKVVMMTGYSVEEMLARALANGALAILNKPFAVADILGVLEEVQHRDIVLVADDDEAFAESLVPVLAAAGYRVVTAPDGEAALRAVEAGGVDCLVLDLKLPVLSGVEVFLRLRREGRQVPTILVSGQAAEDCGTLEEVRALSRGFLMKPFDPALLLDAIAASTR